MVSNWRLYYFFNNHFRVHIWILEDLSPGWFRWGCDWILGDRTIMLVLRVSYYPVHPPLREILRVMYFLFGMRFPFFPSLSRIFPLFIFIISYRMVYLGRRCSTYQIFGSFPYYLLYGYLIDPLYHHKEKKCGFFSFSFLTFPFTFPTPRQ